MFKKGSGKWQRKGERKGLKIVQKFNPYFWIAPNLPARDNLTCSGWNWTVVSLFESRKIKNKTKTLFKSNIVANNLSHKQMKIKSLFLLTYNVSNNNCYLAIIRPLILLYINQCERLKYCKQFKANLVINNMLHFYLRFINNNKTILHQIARQLF